MGISPPPQVWDPEGKDSSSGSPEAQASVPGAVGCCRGPCEGDSTCAAGVTAVACARGARAWQEPRLWWEGPTLPSPPLLGVECQSSSRPAVSRERGPCVRCSVQRGPGLHMSRYRLGSALLPSASRKPSAAQPLSPGGLSPCIVPDPGGSFSCFVLSCPLGAPQVSKRKHT